MAWWAGFGIAFEPDYWELFVISRRTPGLYRQRALSKAFWLMSEG